VKGDSGTYSSLILALDPRDNIFVNFVQDSKHGVEVESRIDKYDSEKSFEDVSQYLKVDKRYKPFSRKENRESDSLSVETRSRSSQLRRHLSN
jgi:hypothetical protein